MNGSLVEILVVLIELYLVLLATDLFLGWLQPEPTRVPRRWTHALTEPLLVRLPAFVKGRFSHGWDLSVPFAIGALGLVRLCLCQ